MCSQQGRLSFTLADDCPKDLLKDFIDVLTFLDSISLKFFLQFLAWYELIIQEDICPGYFEAPSLQGSTDTAPSFVLFIFLHLPHFEPRGVLVFAVAV